MNAYAAAEWQRATDTLAAALLLANTHPDDAASRAHYPALYAVSAVLALEGESFERHSAVRAAVHRDLIRDRGWPAELGRDYDGLMELRDVADYGGVTRVSREAAQRAADQARRILDFVRQSHPELASG